MVFWLDRQWQADLCNEIQEELESVSRRLGPEGLSDGQWTTPMMTALATSVREACRSDLGEPACGFPGGERAGHRKGWLYDLACWIEGEDEEFLGLPLVAESEWRKWTHVLDDFDKLVQARAGLRVMIFQYYANDTPEDWGEILLARSEKFAPKSADDAWLLICWRDGRFEYHSNLRD